MSNLVRLIQTGYDGEEPRLHVRVAVLEDRVKETMQNLATKAELKEVEGRLGTKIEATRTEIEKVRTDVEKVRTDVEKVRTDFEKGQKENRTWLLTATIAIIGVIIAIATFFGLKETQVVYVPQEIASALASTAQELKELRSHLMDIEQANAPDEPTD